MTRIKFWSQLFCMLAIFAAFNVVVVARASKRSAPRELLQRMSKVPNPELVFVGNSLMEAGVKDEFVAEELKQRGLSIPLLNIGLGATGPIEHLVLFREVLKSQPKIDTCVYGFYDFQLTANEQGMPVGNNALSYYVEPDVTAKYYATNWYDKIRFQIIRRVPYLREQLLVWERVEKLRRRLAQIGMPPVKTNAFGRAADFKALESSNSADFDRQCRYLVDHNTPFTPPFAEFVNLARQHSRRWVIVEMPQPSNHRQTFYRTPGWSLYRSYVQQKIEGLGGEFVDASDWVPSDDQFADVLHLDLSGAQTFTRRTVDVLYPRH